MIYYDFHIHSALSPCGDNDMTPNNIVNMAKIIGLDAIAVSDHNCIGNVCAAMKAGERAGIKVIPAMEVETSEEVHILTLYPDFCSAEFVARQVYEKLPDIKNRPDIFGEQILFDDEDNVTGYEEKLLISPADITINRLFDMVSEVGGMFVPAHVDRHSYSVLTNLGFIPDDIDIKWVEVSKRVECLEEYLENRKELKRYGILRNSDAHYLENISECDAWLDCKADEIFEMWRVK